MTTKRLSEQPETARHLTLLGLAPSAEAVFVSSTCNKRKPEAIALDRRPSSSWSIRLLPPCLLVVAATLTSACTTDDMGDMAGMDTGRVPEVLEVAASEGPFEPAAAPDLDPAPNVVSNAEGDPLTRPCSLTTQ